MKGVEVNPAISDLHPRLRIAEGSAPAFSSTLELKPGYPEQVVGGHGEEELSAHAHRSSEPCLAHPRNRLSPSEDLFDAFPLSLTQLVSATTRRASIQNRRDLLLLGNVREDTLLGQSDLELSNVVSLVRTQSHSPTRGINRASHHRQRGLRFGSAIGLRHQSIRAQPVFVFHQDMTDVAQLRGLSVPLAEQLGLRVRRRAVGRVASLLTPEVHLGVASATLWGLLSAPGAKALHRGTSLDQSPVHREVFVRQQSAPASLLDHLSEELPEQIRLQQPLPVLGECRRVEGRPHSRQVQKPPEQKVVLQPLAEQPLRPHRVQRYQNLRLQQHFRRYRRPPSLRVNRRKLRLQSLQRVVCHPLDHPNRVILRDQLLRRHRHHQRRLLLCISSHKTKVQPRSNDVNQKPTFSAAC